MDKFEQLKREYEMLQKSCEPWLEGDGREFEYYIEMAILRIWNANNRYSEDYARVIQDISGQARTPVQITRAMLDSSDPSTAAKIPSFFANMTSDDFNNNSHHVRNFIGDLKSLLAGAAFINGDFTIEESNTLSAELKKLMTYAISQGVKVEYSTGRIRDKITPLNEGSYLDPGQQSTVSADVIFDALSRDFLRPAGIKSGWPGSGMYGSGGSGSGKSGSGVTGSGGSGRDPLGNIFDSGTGIGSVPGEGVTPAQPGFASANASQPQNAVEVKEDPRTMDELLEELDGLVGLTGIKEDIRSLMNFIQITKLRQERGLDVPTISYHLVFTGNPGTGKTTVARLVAGLYHRIGILPKGQLVEADRSRLVAGYTGQTALKTMDVINQAMGGVLFIDEAYALVNDDQDSFGKEAIETILKAMEDHRDELVVIVAGYTELMHTFIESNPGFRSRFSKYFEFPDYTGQELLDIFKIFCRKNGYHLTEEAEAWLLLQFNDMYEHRDSHFGNGRTARNVFEKAIHQQANRLAELTGQDAPIGKSKNAEPPENEDQDKEADTDDGENAGPDTGANPSGTEPERDEETSTEALTDDQLQELTQADLEAAVEAENRKSALPN